MLKVLTAFTEDTDERGYAAADLLEQLDLEFNLLKNSVGILSCAPECLNSGFVKYLCGKLPFEVIGMTTMGTGVNGRVGDLACSVAVLTSDDVTFEKVRTGTLHNRSHALKDAYAELTENGAKEPSFALAYIPYTEDYAATNAAHALFETAGDVPLFGGVCCDTSAAFTDCKVIENGVGYEDEAVMVVAFGGVRPDMFCLHPEAFADVKLRADRVTETDGQIVKRVGGKTFKEYLEVIGLKNVRPEQMRGMPIVFSHKTFDEPEASVLHAVTPDGWGVMGIPVPEDSTVMVSYLDRDGILNNAQRLLDDLGGEDEAAGVLIQLCMTRPLGLYNDPNAELRMIADGLRIPAQITFSAGEIAPVMSKGVMRNYFHNYALCACVFR